MGYYSRLSGSVSISPFIGYLELKNAGYDLDKKNYREEIELLGGYGELYFELDTEAVDTMEGVLTRIAAVSVEVYDGDEMKAYGLVDSLMKVVADFGESHRFNGAIYVYGEEGGDIWRVLVDDNVVKEEHPQLIWPDGQSTKLGR